MRQKAARNREEGVVTRKLVKLGGSLDVDPGPTLLSQVKEAAFNVAWLREQVQRLSVDEMVGPVDFDKPKAEPHVHIRMYAEWHDRLASLCERALRAGVEERAVQLAEVEAARLLGSFATAIDAAGLTDDQAETMRRVMSDALAAVPALGA